ncbi:MAG: hypothetical protein DYG92_00985 [Leptolyngbya sp. PLA1]|nr:hypothetical protein [Leptolyngbya sp. PLA1]
MNHSWKVRAGACLATSLACGVCLAQPSDGRPDLDFLASLPARTEFLIAADDLAWCLESRAGQRLLSFVAEMSPWDRSVAAWRDAAASLDMTPDMALQAFAGDDVAFCITGISGPTAGRRPQHAVIATVSSETEALLRSQLKPAPRKISHDAPVLALESGAFQLSTAPGPLVGARALSRVLIAPNGSGDLFDRLLPVVSTPRPAGSSRLGDTRAFSALRSLPPSRIALLYRSMSEGAGVGEEQYLALTAGVADDTLAAEFRATDTMLLSKGGTFSAWPAEAVKLLETDASLLLAGSPRRQPLDLGEDASGRAQRPLMVSLLDNLKLPAEVTDAMDGVALLAVHRTPAGAAVPALSITCAIPVSDLEAVKPITEAWIARVVGAPGMKLPPSAPGTVPVMVLGDARNSMLPGFVQPGGSLAWTYAQGADAPGGWWVLNIRTAAGDEARGGAAAAELARRLSEPPPESDRTVYRLIVRPADLAEIIRANSPSSGESAMRAFRWIERVETRLQTADAGMLEGTVAVRFRDAP